MSHPNVLSGSDSEFKQMLLTFQSNLSLFDSFYNRETHCTDNISWCRGTAHCITFEQWTKFPYKNRADSRKLPQTQLQEVQWNSTEYQEKEERNQECTCQSKYMQLHSCQQHNRPLQDRRIIPLINVRLIYIDALNTVSKYW